jgi:hypothetical protein
MQSGRLYASLIAIVNLTSDLAVSCSAATEYETGVVREQSNHESMIPAAMAGVCGNHL